MKRLPLILLCVVLVAIAIVLFKPFSSEEDIAAVEEIDTIADETEESMFQPRSIDWEHYYGDTLWQGGNKTVCISFADEVAANVVQSIDGTTLITLTDSTPTDTCVVMLYSSLWADGNMLKMTVGADTLVKYFDRLPRKIDAPRELALPGCQPHSYHKSFELNKSSFDCEFGFTSLLPEPQPAWLKQFIATVMLNDIQALYLDDKGAEGIWKDYCGQIPRPRKIDGIDASKRTPEQIAEHFAKVHERLYRKQYGKDDLGPKYDYMMEVMPTWQSADSSLVTYRFYTFYYSMGAHGYPEEYYLTFDTKTGRLMGWKDFLDEEEMKKSILELSRRITTYKEKHYNDKLDELYPADLGEDDLSSNNAQLLKETFDGKIYPRPAITRHGMLFSYQPYEKGGYMEGVLHFIVPYKSN